jgi:hypothetical protein
LAAEHIGVGATALGRASHAQDALYSQAFFALSVGFERACKLGLTIDHAQTHGHFLDRKSLKALGHDLRDLLEKLDEVGQRRAASSESRRLPRSEIHNAIVGVLTDFAKNVTRYYNLELLAEEPTAVDPIASWMERVTRPVLAVHDREHYRLRREARAASFELLEPMVLIRQTSETGEALNTVAGNTIHGRTVEFARRWERMYLLQIARFVATVLSHLGQPTNQMQVPYLSDFFRNFLTTDEFFRSKRNWSIY